MLFTIECQSGFNAIALRDPTEILDHYNYLGWCRVMDQNRDLTPETLLHYALGYFQHLTVT